jgi:hypothetical protein
LQFKRFRVDAIACIKGASNNYTVQLIRVHDSFWKQQSINNELADPGWKTSILLTPRRCVRDAWNSIQVNRLAANCKQRIYLCHALDTSQSEPLSIQQTAGVAALNPKLRADLPDVLEIAIGMPCMVTENIGTSIGLANGSRGTVVGIILDPREPQPHARNVSLNAICINLC